MSDSSIKASFVLYQQPGVIPMKKGPFSNDDQVEKMLREMKPHHPEGTIYTVAQITDTDDLWLTHGDEFITLREIARMPDQPEDRELCGPVHP